MITVTIDITEKESYVITLEHVSIVTTQPPIGNIDPKHPGIYIYTIGSDGYVFLKGWSIQKWNDMIQQMMRSAAILKPH